MCRTTGKTRSHAKTMEHPGEESWSHANDGYCYKVSKSSNKNYSHLRTPITSFIPAILLVGTNTSILLFLTKTFSATAAEVSLCCVQVTCLIIPKASIDLSSFKDSILPNARGFLTTPQNSKTFVVGLYKYKYIPMI